MQLEIQPKGVQPRCLWIKQHLMCVQEWTTASVWRSLERRIERGIFYLQVWFNSSSFLFNCIFVIAINHFLHLISIVGKTSNCRLAQWTSGLGSEWKRNWRVWWTTTIGIQHERIGMEWRLSWSRAKVNKIHEMCFAISSNPVNSLQIIKLIFILSCFNRFIDLLINVCIKLQKNGCMTTIVG